jgi:cytoskeletal protein CcmA (bactofilin family)
MFGKQPDSAASRSQSLIQEGVSIRGEIRSEGDVRLEGSLEGLLETRARVIVGATGKAIANLEADEVLVMGRVEGKIVGHRRIELRKGAHVEGDLVSKSLVIEEGVFFQGLAQMTEIDSGGASHPADESGNQHGRRDAQGPIGELGHLNLPEPTDELETHLSAEARDVYRSRGT